MKKPDPVELHKTDGSKRTINVDTLLIGECQACKALVLALEQAGSMLCAHCGSVNVKWQYVRTQFILTAENESEFMGWASRYGPKGPMDR